MNDAAAFSSRSTFDTSCALHTGETSDKGLPWDEASIHAKIASAPSFSVMLSVFFVFINSAGWGHSMWARLTRPSVAGLAGHMPAPAIEAVEISGREGQ
jgi:hypothetical protein